MHVQLFLNRWQVDHAQIAHFVNIAGVADAGPVHRLHRGLNRAPDTGFTDEHVMRFLGQHEAAGAAERVKAGLRQAFKLHLAVTIREISEHEKGQPVRCFLVKGPQHTRRLVRTRGAAQQIVGLCPPILAEVFLQQIDHRPQVAPFLHVDLKQVAHVIQRRRGQAQKTLLFDGAGFRIALDDDQPFEHVTVFARHFLPGRLTGMFTAGDFARLHFRRQQNAPAVFGHLDIVKPGPAFGVHRYRRAQIHHGFLKIPRDEPVPPVDIAGVPFLQRLQHLAVARQPDIIGDAGVIIDIVKVQHAFLLCSSSSGQP